MNSKVEHKKVGGSVVDLLMIATPIVGFCNCSIFFCALLCVSILVLQSS